MGVKCWRKLMDWGIGEGESESESTSDVFGRLPSALVGCHADGEQVDTS